MTLAVALLTLLLAVSAPGEPCPPPVSLANLSRFPPPDVAGPERVFCSEARAALKTRSFWDPDAGEALGHATFCEDVWDDLCRAQDELSGNQSRIGDLERLRGKIGAAAFASGAMPYVVTAFRRLD